jgi:cytoskeletal protein CcmA (bactofilin family)
MAIFSKDAPADKPAPPRPATSRPEHAPGGTTSYVGPNIAFEGTISGEENVIIEGTIKGTIDLRSDLRVGARARVEANVHARTVTVEGTMSGDVSAEQKIELYASAVVDGNIKAPKIVVAEGARFRGAVDMGSRKPAEQTEKKESE